MQCHGEDGSTTEPRQSKAARSASCRHAAVAGITAVCLLVTLLQPAPRRMEGLFKIGVIKGIDKETQDQIDSGEWPPDMVKDMMQKGLLPPGNFDEPDDSDNFNISSDNDIKDAKRKGEMTSTNSTSTNSTINSTSTKSGGYQVSDHNGAAGHCERDPNIDCQSYTDCIAVTGACVWWFCSMEHDKVCQNTNDCVQNGSICTGPGYCKSFPEAACQTDADCTPFGGECIVGGHCLQQPNFACLDNSDCDSHDKCSFQRPRWWRVDEEFPKDEDFGPYQNWTDRQLRQKMLIAMKKIIHTQRDLEGQVTINTRLGNAIRTVHRTQSSWEGDGPEMIQDADKQTNLSGVSTWTEISSLLDPLVKEVLQFRRNVSVASGIKLGQLRLLRRDLGSLQQRRRTAFGMDERIKSTIVSAYNSTMRGLQPSTEALQVEHYFGREWNQTSAYLGPKYGNLLSQYKGSATTEFGSGVKSVKQALQDFRDQTEQSLANGQQNIGEIGSIVGEHVTGAEDVLSGLRNMTLAVMNSSGAAIAKMADRTAYQFINASNLFQ